jgi:ParB family chromosome partitioning protein
MSEQKNYQEINIDSLVPFKNHPFDSYGVGRLADMTESIRANGILSPIIVRPIPDEEGKYEILSGHNRVIAAKAAHLEKVPVINKGEISDEDAMFIVTETNLIQRSFADMKHSERAIAIAVHYNAIKTKSGYRSDLLEGMDELSCSLLGNRTRTMEKLGEQRGLSKNTIARYLRVNMLSEDLKYRLDDGDFGLYAAVSLSYLRSKEQKFLHEFLGDDGKVGIRQAEHLRKESEERELKKSDIGKILNPEKPVKRKPFKVKADIMEKFFVDEKDDDVERMIEEALAQYFASKGE